MNCLFKGAPGAGKTTAAGSYPDPYILSLDHKIASLKKFYPDKNIEFDFFDTFWSVFKKLEELQEMNPDNFPWGTVVCDGLTKLSLFAMQHSIDFRKEERSGKKPNEQAGNKRGELLLPEIEDYNAELMGLYQIIWKLKAINSKFNVHTILIAHVLTIEYKDLKNNTRITKSLLTGGKKIAAGIPGEFDEIYHFKQGLALEGGGSGFKVLTRNDGDDEAQTALPLPPEIDVTNKCNFYDRIQGYIKNQI